MNKTKFETVEKPILVDTTGLKAITQTGYKNAVRIGTEANARVQLGRSVRWNVEKVKKYINMISTE